MSEHRVDREAAIKMYEGWPERGRLVRGRRLTLMTARTDLVVGDSAQVLHVYEIIEPGGQLYVMGPKPVEGEQLSGPHAVPVPPAPPDLLEPPLYDGRVVPSPGIDHNFEVTTYSFVEEGRYDLVWRVGELVSNTLEFKVGL
jgi:hypothetical protein